MAKGSGGLVLLGAAALGVGALCLTGKIPGYGRGAPDTGAAAEKGKEAGGAAVEQGNALFDWYFSHGWAYTGIVAAALATVGVITWKKIGNWGRTLVIVCAAITVTVLVLH